MLKIFLPLIILFMLFQCSQSVADEPDYHLTQITNKIQVIYGPFDLPDNVNKGFRNNVVIITTNVGLVIFDPGGSAYAGEMIVKQLQSKTNLPVVAIFNSHAHGDHWLGNEGIKRKFPNAIIYGHPIMKIKVEGSEGINWLETINRLTKKTADGKVIFPPDKVVNDGDVITVGDVSFRIHHQGRAHTDNDIMIEIEGEDTLFMGDVVRNGLLGLMESDSSFKGNIEIIEFILKQKYKHYIPGHGKVGDTSMVKFYGNYLKTLRRKVAELYDEGLTDFEMKPEVAKALSDYDHWAGFDMRMGPLINRAYLEIEVEKF